MTSSSNSSSDRQRTEGLTLRALRAFDRPHIERILKTTGAFSDEEVLVAMELVDHGISGTDPDYRFIVCEAAGHGIVGYACYGPTPLTDGVYDLYWIAVSPTLHGRGIGAAIMRGVESAVKGQSGRMVLIETASKPSYAATRLFYDRTGYGLIATIPDFYTVGDDKLIYGKRV